MNDYFVYMMASRMDVLYIGVTCDLKRRIAEHKAKVTDGFTSRYNVDKLVYYETTADIRSAITSEKQLKGWLRSKKVALIESVNPQWRDLSEDWE